jgi:hypothetical protein
VKLARSVPFEVGAMLVVLWGAAALGATAPAPPAGSAGPALQADTTSQVGDLTVHTNMEPEQPGTNTLVVQVRGGSAASAVTAVQATLRQAGHTPETLLGRAAGDGDYAFPPAQVAATGALNVDVTITRADGKQVRTECAWTVAAPPSPPPPGLPTTPWAPLLDAVATGLAVALAGGLITMLVMGRLRRALARS